MHPAYSVIFFTTASGAGYGLLALMGLLGAVGMLPPDRWFGITGFLIGLIAITGGLLSSTFHLGRPERAWRAFSQWRSSWLSREGVLAMFTYLPAGITALGWVIFEEIWVIPALILAVACIATIATTSMIYASLKTVRRWRNGWTTPVYLAMGLASGSLWLSLIAAFFGIDTGWQQWVAPAILLLAAAMKLGYWHFVDTDEGVATAGSATGLGRFGKVRLLTAPHTEENYLLKEMGYRIARKHAVKLRLMSLAFAFALPIFLLLLATMLWPTVAIVALFLATLANAAGTLTERWLFFAEARHTVTLYYGAERA